MEPRCESEVNVKQTKPQKRRRVELKRIDNKAALEVSFSKRRKGLFNKGTQLSVLCGAEIAIISFSTHGRPYVFGHPSADAIIDRYLGRITTPQSSVLSTANINISNLDNNQNQHSHALGKLEEMKKRVGEDSGIRWERPIDGLGLEELRCYIKELETLKEKVNGRLEKMSGEDCSFFDMLPPIIDIEGLTADNGDLDWAQFDPLAEWIVAENDDLMMPFEHETAGRLMEEGYEFNPMLPDPTREEPMIKGDGFYSSSSFV